MSACLQDASFGPVSTCRSFDFTLVFESAILSIPASCIFTLVAPFLLFRLHNAQRVLNPFQYLGRLGQQLIIWKTATVIALCITDILALAAWASSKSSVPGSNVVLSALALRVVASALAVPLVYLEFFRRLHGSPLLPLYLSVTILCDAARVRTFAFTVLQNSSAFFFAAFVASFALQILAWILETAPKGRFVERAEGDHGITEEETSSFFARLLITSVDPVLIKGFKTTMTIQSLGSIHSNYDAEHLYEVGEPEWQKHMSTGKSHPLLRTMFSSFGFTLLAPILPCVVAALAQVTAPTLISDVIAFIESYSTGNPADEQPVANGWGLVAAYGLVFTIYSLSWSLFQMSCLRSSVAVRGFLVQMIYRKALLVHTDVAKEIGTGSSTSLMSVDIERMVATMEPMHMLYYSFIIVLVGLVILYKAVGVSFVAAIILAVAFFVSIPYLTRAIPGAQKAWSAQTDLRVKLVNSVLKNIKAVKLSGYEEILIDKLDDLRHREVRRQMVYYRWLLATSFVTNWLKSLISLATLTTYTIVSLHSSNHQVNTGTFFTTIAVLSVITDPLLQVGQRFAGIMAASASLKRIEVFLMEKEKQDKREESVDIAADSASFGTNETTLLKDLNFTLPEKRVTMIIGAVGSGKSTLLHGLMGEINLLGGSLRFPKSLSVGFCSQDAWLRPGNTIRQNIQFLAPLNPALYRMIIKACALDVDFKIWPEGDKQKAQGLSGGQKARIALARALYARPDILILDDVFSALDKTTEEHIFQSLFGAKGLLNDKTVILATNAVHRLPRADHILVLEDQTIVQQGTFQELSSVPGTTQQLLSLVEAKEVSQDERAGRLTPADDGGSSHLASLAAPVDDIEDEMAADTAKKGAFKVFATGGGFYSFLLSLLLVGVFSAMPGIIPIYVQAWTTTVQRDQSHMVGYLGGYVAIEVAYAILFLLGIGYTFLVYNRSNSLNTHAAEIRSLLRSPLSYFDDKPIGRLLSRFSQDLYILDFECMMFFNNCSGLSIEMLTNAIIIVVAAPYVGIALLVTFIACITMQRFYVRTSRQVRRMDFIAKSPLYTLFAETMDVNGLKTIRAVRAEDELSGIAIVKGNTSQVPFYIMHAIKKWLGLVLGLVVTIINVLLVAIAVIQRRSTNAGVLAVALVQATSLMLLLNWTIVMAAEFETALVAISRIQEVIELPREEEPSSGSEADKAYEEEDKGYLDEKTKEKEQNKIDRFDWITAGSVRFQDVVLKYREDLPPALKDLTFKIPGGSRVGIVGRSGCGKSTALSALFRMIELQSGKIFIDGVDITTLPRSVLRNAMTIIPQDPLMLELTVREILDLEGRCSDQEIWSALDKTQCKALIEAFPDKLDARVTGDGGDFSRGERQLLALARGLLRNRKILVLDEASSSLDVETDAVVQRVLRTAFERCTIITVAHRLNTLLDYDKIIVLSQGQLVEEGHPDELRKNTMGPFSQLLRGEQNSAAGQEQSDDITEL